MSAARSEPGSGPAAGLNGSAPGQEVHAEVEPAAREQQVLDLGVGLRPTDDGVELEQHELRNPEAERTGELAHDELRDERLRPLARTPELEHVETVVVRLDERGERAALPQGRHVPRRGDPAHALEPNQPARRSGRRR